MDGIVNINKPAGITSFGTVSRVKHILGVKKAGHTGTLDPEARGVLPICIGKATKIAQFLMISSKVYIARMKLGIRTDTQDSSGKVIKQRRIYNVDEHKISKIFSKYIGEIEQIPPMYSAMKFQGQRLYTLARKGISVERKPKKVIINFIRLIDIKDDLVTFEVKTSPGTYIRTLCDSIGEELGCGAHMLELNRIRVGLFKIEYSVSLEELSLIREEGRVHDILYSMDKALSFLPRIRVREGIKEKISMGVSVTKSGVENIPKDFLSGTSFRVHDPLNQLLAIAEATVDWKGINSLNQEDIAFRLKRVLADRECFA